MKYFVITLALFLIGGCTNTMERPDYIGTVPAYANKNPHPSTCGCCSFVTILEVGKEGVMQEWKQETAIGNNIKEEMGYNHKYKSEDQDKTKMGWK